MYSAESAKFCYHDSDSVATLGDADMKLGRCISVSIVSQK